MKLNSRFAGSMFMAVTLLLSAVPFAAAQSDADGHAPILIVGTWQVVVTVRNCDNGQQLAPPFQSLLTFGSEGTLVETTANPGFYPAERGPGHGNWSRSGMRAFNASSLAYVTVSGQLTMKQRIDQKIEFVDDPDKFHSVAAVEFFDPYDHLLKSGCATADAVRYK
jgi:hypothetical protein